MKTTYKNFALSSVYKGDKDWGNDMANSNNHIVTVKNLENGKYTRFEFWESISEKKIRTEKQLLWAFRCFLDDALSGDMDIEEFFDEFGYGIDGHVKQGLKAYKACVNAKRKLKRILDGDFNKVYDLLNQLSEDGIE